ncbi:MAG: SURF1 family protein [Halioglobus sp.]
MVDAVPRLRFDAEWRLTLVTVLMVPLMIGLGFWQLQRAEEKAALSATFEARREQAPVALSDLRDKPSDVLAYTPVRLRGSFVPEAYFLLDNQVHGGQFGYEVLGVFQLAGDQGSALVNRGWIAGDPGRKALPLVPKIEGPLDITGHVYVAPGPPFLLTEQQLENSWPKIIQAVEMDKLSAAVTTPAGGNVFPFTIRIDADEPGALLVDWQVVNVSPQKHQAYAVQWFAMAAVLFVFYLLRSSNLLQFLKSSPKAGE